jgi:branched-chain amino acid transport system ATP-binding protein
MTEPLLQVEEVTAGFGAVTVLHGVSFEVPAGSVGGVFGLNGAGKSVTMKTLAGIVPARSGRVLMEGQDITRLSPEKRVALGMGHVPQGRQVFPGLTVEENLRLGAYTLRRRDRSRYAAALDGVYDRFPVLRERRAQLAGTMSGGQQASLSVARALVNEPRLVLVDEPSAGLSPVAQLELYEVLRTVMETGVTMVLVEQNVAFGLSLVDTAHLMQTGVVVHSAPVSELDESTLATHLGIGSVLRAATGRALATRQTVPTQPRGGRADAR